MTILKLLALSLLALAATAGAQETRIDIDAADVLHPVSRYLTGACLEDVNHEIYGGLYSQMIFGESFQEPSSIEVSRMWRPIRSGTAIGGFYLNKDRPFTGTQSQEITFRGGTGEIGVENRGLNRWGMYFVKNKPYEGYIWARAEQPATVTVSLESGEGGAVYATQAIRVDSRSWRRFDFVLTPSDMDKTGRFAITLKEPGSVVVGHAFLEPGEWGRFQGLPVRKDVADALVNEGITVLRYGGSMVNSPGYRWKNMIGPPDRRPPYQGTWYPYSSDGWGIFDFMNFCQAAGFMAIPDFNIDESPADMADFVKRAKPFHLTHLELGNEEHVNEKYFQKFKPLAEAIWAADPQVILVVGDFFYNKAIEDPYHFEGGAVSTLAAHKEILDLAKEHGREVWFDVHIGTEAPPEPGDLAGVRTFIEQLGKISPGANYRVAIFEFNANNHAMRRALANASAILQVERMSGKLAVACSANCLQPDGQNDNGWNQGLLFLNPSQTWLQPPGWVTQMISQNYEPLLVKSAVAGATVNLNVAALMSEDANTLVLQAVNPGALPIHATLRLNGFANSDILPEITQLTGPLDAENTASNPDTVKPVLSTASTNGYIFPAHSFTIVRWSP